MLTIFNIHKSYDATPLLQGVSFSVAASETLCLLGPSGSGKSTLLRIIAGLEAPEAGQVLWDGQDLSQVPVHKRSFGLVFQDYALFPHRTVAENVAFGLRMQNLPPKTIEQKVQEALAQVNLSAFGKRRITDLSGGEQQRVALARALAPSPRLLMFDEPLGALDRALREQLIAEIRQTLHQTGIPAVYVTHDQEEAFAISDRMALLHNGRIVQQGNPWELHRSPSSPWVAAFLGLGSLVEGQVAATNPLQVQTDLGLLTCTKAKGQHLQTGDRAILVIKSGFDQGAGSKKHNRVKGVVRDITYQHDGCLVKLTFASTTLTIKLSEPPIAGSSLEIELPATSILCFKAEESGG